MLLFNYGQNLFEKILDFTFSINFLFLIFPLTTIYHILLNLFRNRNFIKHLKKFEEVTIDSIYQLKEIPPINIFIPTWKEGENFKGCLNSIEQTIYPKLKLIVNAGGSQETIEIVQSFKGNIKIKLIY